MNQIYIALSMCLSCCRSSESCNDEMGVSKLDPRDDIGGGEVWIGGWGWGGGGGCVR